MIQLAPASYHPIHRQNGNLSKQPRFKEVHPDSFFTSLFRWVNTDIQEEPLYGTRQRDAWLRRVWKLEPYLAGVINSVVAIDKNRGWTITGGRNQVNRFVKMLHERFYFATDLQGWRMSFGGCAQAYYTSDLGAVIELARLGGPDGPLWELYFTDPSRCNLTGDPKFPLQYSARGKSQDWGGNDYFRIVSLPDTDESLYGLGFSAVSRCIELAKIMVGIYQYDNEMLLNRAPRGLLLLKGITQDQWEDAMSARVARLDGDEKKYYGAVHVLATLDPGVEIEAQLVALASLPAEFDQRTFTDLLIYGYSLCFGYDPREFWPVSSGALGTATETETQHRKAGGKGGLDFTLGFAEKLNEELPDTALFEFEERDLDGELADAQVEQAKAEVVTTIYESGLREGAGLLDREEGRVMLAERGLIDQDWTLNQEDTTATDTDDVTRNERIQRAIWRYPDEPIVRYRFSVKDGKEHHNWQTLVKPHRSRRSIHPVTRSIKRQIESKIDDYQRQLDELARQANGGELDQGEFEEALEALTAAIMVLSLLRGTEGANEAEQLLIDAALLVLDGPSGYEAGMEVLTDSAILEDALPPEAVNRLQSEMSLSLASTLAADIYSGQYQDNAGGLLSRLAMWGSTAIGLYYFGQLIGHPEQRYVWRRGATLEPCGDCTRLDGQVHTGSEWMASGWQPRSLQLECSGHRCRCSLVATDMPVSGSF